MNNIIGEPPARLGHPEKVTWQELQQLFNGSLEPADRIYFEVTVCLLVDWRKNRDNGTAVILEKYLARLTQKIT
jgi:hypothetical protein